MVDTTQDLHERVLEQGDLAQCQRSLIELPVPLLALDDAVHKAPHPLGRGLLKHPGGRFDGIRHHGDGRLLRLGLGSRITEIGLVHVLFAELLLRPRVEEADELCAVVLGDEVLHDLGQLLPSGQLEALGDVLPHDGGRGVGLQLVVGVPALGLVLHEVVGLQHLAHIVVVEADPAQQPVGADGVGGHLAEIRHVDRVGVAAGRLQGQTPQERAVRVRPLQERLVCGDPGEPLEDGHEAHGDDRAQGRVRPGPHQRGGNQPRRAPLQKSHGQKRHGVGTRDDGHEHPCLSPASDDANAHGGRGPTYHGGE